MDDDEFENLQWKVENGICKKTIDDLVILLFQEIKNLRKDVEELRKNRNDILDRRY